MPTGDRRRPSRGNAADRRARKLYLMARYGVEGIVTCYLCAVPMLLDDLTSDRIVPGVAGGTYRRENLRPACGPCNSETGGRMAARRKADQ